MLKLTLSRNCWYVARPRTVFHSRCFSKSAISRDPQKNSYFSLFPQTFQSGPPPSGPFKVDARQLRSEFLRLQSKTHPDLARTESDRVAYEEASSELNKAYSTLVSPLSRALYLLDLSGFRINEDSGRNMPQDATLLMEVYEILEEIENCETEEEVAAISQRIEERIKETEDEMEKKFDENLMEEAREVTSTLKYWINIREALKEWEPGKEFRMVH